MGALLRKHEERFRLPLEESISDLPLTISPLVRTEQIWGSGLMSLCLPDAGAECITSGEAIISWKLSGEHFSWLFPPIEKESDFEGEEDKPHIAIWERPHIRAMLGEPVGAPISLTRDEAVEIARLSFASKPELPSGEEYVREVRPLLGHSILRKFKKARG